MVFVHLLVSHLKRHLQAKALEKEGEIRMSKLSPLDLAALILIVVGGLNWGLVGIFDFDLVAAIFGEMSVLARIVYVLVGISAAYAAVRSPHLAHVKEWRKAGRPTVA